MSNRRHIIYMPSFSEYAYREIKKASVDRKSLLSDSERKQIKDDYSLRNFVNKESMEHILMVLTKLGKQWDLRLYDEEEMADRLEFSAVNQFQYPEKRVDVIDGMVRQNIYHMSAMDVMISAHMCSQNSHSKVYEISSGTKMATQGAKGIARIKMSHATQMDEGLQAVDTLNRLLLNQLNSFDWAKQHLGLEQNELRILLSLFAKRQSAMSMREMAQDTLLDGKMSYLNKNVEKLMKDGLIISDFNHGPKAYMREGKGKIPKKTAFYMITAKGSGVVMEYRRQIHKMTFGAS